MCQPGWQVCITLSSWLLVSWAILLHRSPSALTSCTKRPDTAGAAAPTALCSCGSFSAHRALRNKSCRSGEPPARQRQQSGAPLLFLLGQLLPQMLVLGRSLGELLVQSGDLGVDGLLVLRSKRARRLSDIKLL